MLAGAPPDSKHGHCPNVGPPEATFLESSLIGVVEVKPLFLSHRSGRSIVGLITPVTAWRLNVSERRQVEIDDGFQRVGCRTAVEAIGECCEPVGVIRL